MAITYIKLPCKQCGVPVSVNGLAQASHKRMHERQEKERERFAGASLVNPAMQVRK